MTTVVKTATGARWSVPYAVALRQAGHEVEFILPDLKGDLAERVNDAGMRARRAEIPFLQPPRAVPGALRRFRRQLLQGPPDLVISHLHASALSVRAALLGTQIPSLYMSAGPLYLENRVVKLLERLTWRLDTHIVASSPYLYGQYRQLGATRERLSVIPYGIDPEWVAGASQFDPAQVRAEIGIPTDAFVAVICAYFYSPKRLVHRGAGIKGHDHLLEAWREFALDRDDRHLLIVGAGHLTTDEPYFDRLRRDFADVGGSVHWLGGTSDVRQFYVAADVSVSPSLSENLGAPGEAAALGVPSIASAVGGMPDLVVDGWNGWLVPPRSPERLVDALRDSHDKWRSGALTMFGTRARLRAEELLNLPRLMGDFVTVCERAADVPRGRASDRAAR
ncbi:MAG TPA: glycosyltransferase family 4 protein [Acidimicrobiales bacterium]|nr:glycosyltransferase family 4 protein [Acidimicrobiales bacterium]